MTFAPNWGVKSTSSEVHTMNSPNSEFDPYGEDIFPLQIPKINQHLVSSSHIPHWSEKFKVLEILERRSFFQNFGNPIFLIRYVHIPSE